MLCWSDQGSCMNLVIVFFIRTLRVINIACMKNVPSLCSELFAMLQWHRRCSLCCICYYFTMTKGCDGAWYFLKRVMTAGQSASSPLSVQQSACRFHFHCNFRPFKFFLVWSYLAFFWFPFFFTYHLLPVDSY